MRDSDSKLVSGGSNGNGAQTDALGSTRRRCTKVRGSVLRFFLELVVETYRSAEHSCDHDTDEAYIERDLDGFLLWQGLVEEAGRANVIAVYERAMAVDGSRTGIDDGHLEAVRSARPAALPPPRLRAASAWPCEGVSFSGCV